MDGEKKMDVKDQTDLGTTMDTEQSQQVVVLSERPTNWGVLALICLGVFLGTSIIAAVIVSAIGASIYGVDILLGEGLSDITNIASIIADIIVVLILVPIIRKHNIWNWKPLDRRIGKNAENIALIIMMFAAIFYVELCAGELLDSIFDTRDATLQQQAILTLGNRWIMLINVVIIVPIAEETVFRGGIYGSLKQSIGVIPAALLSSLVFGIAHMNGWISIVTFFIGLLLCLVYEKTGSIIYSMAIHAVNNYISVTATEIYLPEKKSEMAALAIICVVIGILIAMLFSKRNQNEKYRKN